MAELRRLLLGKGDGRAGAPEPSLLPYLARWVPDGALDPLLQGAEELALRGGLAPPWFPLWEATVDVVLRRGGRLWDELETDVRLATLGIEAPSRRQIEALLERLPPSAEPAGGALRGLLAPVLARKDLATLLATVDLDALPAEPTRRLVMASGLARVVLPRDVVLRLVAGSEAAEYPFARRAHLLPALPEALRRSTADELVAELATLHRIPPWYVALVASRVAPFCSSAKAWPLEPLPEPWAALLAALLAAPPAPSHEDVWRAHPHAVELAAVHGIHETSEEALVALRHWYGPMAMAMPDGSEDGSTTRAERRDESVPGGPEEVPGGAQPVDHGAGALAGPPGDPNPRRLQVDVFAGGAQLERAFMAGIDHEVVFSIGRQASIGAAVGVPEPAFAEGVDRIALTVRVAIGTRMQEGVVHLPKDTRRDSTTWTFSLPVARGDRSVAALVAVYDGIVLLQAGVLSGGVVADIASERTHAGRIDLQVNALVHQLAAAPLSNSEGSIVTDGRRLIAAHAGGAIAVDASALAERVEPLWDRLEAAASLLHDGQPEELHRLLRDLAIHGRSLRARFADRLPAQLRGEGPIQVVAADPTAILPLELVYDGRQPTSASVTCVGWRESLIAGSCAECPGGKPVAGQEPDPPAVCPLKFWGLRRVIEHHTGLGGSSGGFEVRSERTDASSALPNLSGAVVAASSRVDEAGVVATVEAARLAFSRASRATTWKEWTALVRTERPAVLVLLPHQASDEETSPPVRALEVGDVLLAEGALTPAQVGRAESGTGPVVILFGCNTAGDELPVTSFAGEFRQNGAAFVVSTLVEVIADEAPRAAQVLMQALVRAQQSAASGTVGEALLQARRALLADGLVFALGVIGHGDPEWQMSARP